jgi:hypothetical protein
MSAFCRGARCGGQPILWAATPAGRMMPVDESTLDEPGGMLAVWAEARNDIRCRILDKAEGLDLGLAHAGPKPTSGERWAHHHWELCPDAESFRARAGGDWGEAW